MSRHIWLVVRFPSTPEHIKTRSFILTFEAKHHPRFSTLSGEAQLFHPHRSAEAFSDVISLFTVTYTRLSKGQLPMSPPAGNTEINGHFCSPPRQGDLQEKIGRCRRSLCSRPNRRHIKHLGCNRQISSYLKLTQELICQKTLSLRPQGCPEKSLFSVALNMLITAVTHSHTCKE